MSSDDTPNLSKSLAALQAAHPLPAAYPYTTQTLHQLRQLSLLISHRATAYLAVGVHALWTLRLAEEQLAPGQEDHVTIGCNGSVIEKYPGFRARTQRYLDELCVSSGGHAGSIRLEIAWESAIFGAAIGVSCLEGKEAHDADGAVAAVVNGTDHAAAS
jgi:hexokinase